MRTLGWLVIIFLSIFFAMCGPAVLFLFWALLYTIHILWEKHH